MPNVGIFVSLCRYWKQVLVSKFYNSRVFFRAKVTLSHGTRLCSWIMLELICCINMCWVSGRIVEGCGWMKGHCLWSLRHLKVAFLQSCTTWWNQLSAGQEHLLQCLGVLVLRLKSGLRLAPCSQRKQVDETGGVTDSMVPWNVCFFVGNNNSNWLIL